MKFLLIPTCIVTFLVMMHSCRKSNDGKCLTYKTAPVTKVEGPQSGLVNQEITLTVFFNCYNGCGQFEKMEQTETNKIYAIKVIAKYEGCVCTQDAPIRQTSYKFKSTQAGVYTLNFYKNEQTALTHTITLQ